MASTQTGEKDEQAEKPAFVRRSFASSQASPADSEQEAGGGHGGSQEQGALMSRRAAIGGVGMGAAALLCFVLGAGLSGGEATISDRTATEVFALQEWVKAAQTKEESLPAAKDAERGLVLAQTSADAVAQLQNDYRHLAPEVAAAGGKLDGSSASTTQRNLVPYFAPSVDQSSLQPWFLLASDKDVPAGVGIPMSFDSGFEWVAQRPYLIDADSRVRVTWLAVETHPAEGQTPAVLAWARADYDLTRKTLFDVRSGTTATGEALRLEVKGG